MSGSRKKKIWIHVFLLLRISICSPLLLSPALAGFDTSSHVFYSFLWAVLWSTFICLIWLKPNHNVHVLNVSLVRIIELIRSGSTGRKRIGSLKHSGSNGNLIHADIRSNNCFTPVHTLPVSEFTWTVWCFQCCFRRISVLVWKHWVVWTFFNFVLVFIY